MITIPSQDYLKEALENGSLLPLVGAGVSMSIKDKNGDGVFPSWKKLIERAADKLDSKECKLVNMLIEEGMLTDAAETAKKHLAGEQWFQFLDSQFDPDLNQFDSSSFELPKAIWKLGNQIVTLNYDRVLCHASETGNTKTIKNSSRALLNTMRSPSQDKMVWHLHGHIEEPENLVLTPDSYKRLYEDKDEYEAAMDILRHVLASRSLIFIGCSLSDAELLAELAKQHELFSGNSKVHFVLVHKNIEELVKVKLKNFEAIKILTFEDFGQPLIDVIDSIARLKSASDDELKVEPKKLEAVVEPQKAQPKIAYLSAKPFGQKLGNFAGVEKILKKTPPFDIDSHVLSVEQLQSLNGYQYLAIACHIKNDKLIVENEWCGSERISIEEFEANLDLNGLKGIIIICDELPSSSTLSSIDLPILFIAELSTKLENIKHLWFQLFKKQSLISFKDNCLLANKNDFKLEIKVAHLNGVCLSKPIKLPSEISKDEVVKFIGRQQDIEECSRKLFNAKDQSECLTILGAGGLGKTSLVKKLAFEYNDRKLFNKGLTFIDCEHFESYQQFHRHVASAFELESVVDVIDHIIENTDFQDGDRLVIIDNAESLLMLDDKDKILSFIGKVNEFATLVITSRESLNIPSESTYQLRDFIAEEAFLLFESKANRRFSDSEGMYLKEHILKEILDHNPLAITLVASSLIQGKDLTDLKKELDDNFFELTQKEQQNFSKPEERNIDRRDSIYNSIDYSYKALHQQHKEALIKLSYFPDGIDLENFKKLTEKDAKARGKAPIKDATIKVLQNKSLVQTSNQFIRLHPLVARFAKNKINDQEETSYLKAIFDYQLSLVNALHEMGLSDDLAQQAKVQLMTYRQVRNLCLIVEKLNITFDDTIIIKYVTKLSSLLGTLETFIEIYSALSKSVERFESNEKLHKFLSIALLVNEYFLGDFERAYEKLLILLPQAEWLALDNSNHIEQAIFESASCIYGNEGKELDIATWVENYEDKSRFYFTELRALGFFQLDYASLCVQDFDSLYVKWALGKLKQKEFEHVLKHIHPKAHIQIAQMLTLKAKLTPLTKNEISKLVVVNPYTKGIKYLLNGMFNEDHSAAQALFKKAIPELKHIKYAYTEALLEYATWLKRYGMTEFDNIYSEGLESAKKHHFRFLQHNFLNLTAEEKIPYSEADYPLPNGKDFANTIQKSTKFCKKVNNN